ncbi:MAG: tetratricopeptide repeat protein [Planctomycetota bacterium]
MSQIPVKPQPEAGSDDTAGVATQPPPEPTLEGEGSVEIRSSSGRRGSRGPFGRFKGWLVTNWRLAVLIGLVLGTAGGIGGFAAWRYADWRLETRDMREAGFIAFDSREFGKAAELLGEYVSRRPEDSSALFRLGMARLQSVPVSQDSLHEARVTLQQVLELDNEDHAARRSLTNVLLQLARVDAGFFAQAEAEAAVLFGVYPRDTYAFSVLTSLMMRERRFDEAIALADGVLNAEVLPEPMRDAAMLTKARSYQRKGELEDAIFWAENCVKESASNLEAQQLYLQLAEQLNRAPESYARHAKRLYEARPDVAMNRVMYAAANQAAARRAVARQDRELAEQYGRQALELLRGTSEMELTSEEMSLVLRQLEQLRATNDVMGFLESQIGRSDAGWLRREYGRRALLMGEPEKVLEYTQGIDATSAETSAELVGLRVLALISSGGNAESVRELLAGLATREGDVLADAWLMLLSGQVAGVPAGEAADSAERLAVIREALRIEPRNPFLLRMRGRILEQLGRTTASRTSFSEAARWAPYWQDPALDLARSYGRSGQIDLMRRWAADGVRRRPTLAAGQLLLVDAMLQSGEQIETDRLDDMMRVVETAQRQDRTLTPLLIRLKLASGASGEAERLLQEAWTDTSLTVAIRRELASVAVTERLAGAAGYLESLMGGSVDLGLARLELSLGSEDAGLDAALEQFEARRVSSASPDDPAWALVRAAALQRAGRPGVRELLAAVSEAHPDNARVQFQVLGFELIWDDVTVLESVLDRARAVADPDSEQIRLMTARYQLQYTEDPEQWGEAVRSLLGIVRSNPQHAPLVARGLLIQATSVFNLTEVEVQERSRLLSARPNDMENLLSITRRLSHLRRDRMVERLLNRVAENPAVDAYEVTRVVAVNHADARKFDRAIQAFERYYVDLGQPTPPDALLGSLYVRANRTQRAQAIADALIAAGSPEEIVQGASLLAQSGDSSRVSELIAGLEDREMSAADREVTRSRLHAILNDGAASIASLRAAMSASPDDISYRLELIRLYLNDARVDDVVRLATEAPQPDARFTLLASRPDLVRASLRDLRSSQVLVEMLASQQRVELDTPVLEKLVQLSSASDAERGALIDGLVQQVDRYPRRLAPQVAVLSWLIEDERWSAVVRRVQRVSLLFPDQTVLFSAGASALLRAGQVNDARSLALGWRNRLGDPWPADQTLIRISGLRAPQSEGGDVRESLGSYLERVESAPSEDPRVTRAVALELLRAGRVADVVAIYGALPPDDQSWIQAWPAMVRVVAEDQALAQTFIDAAASVAGDASTDEVTITQALAWRNVASVAGGGGAEARNNARLLLRPLVDRQDAPTLALNLYGNLALEDQRDADAVDAFTKLLAQNPDDIAAKNNLAMALMQKGKDLERAEVLAREALEAMPGQPAVLDTIARVLAAQDRPAEALPYLEDAVRRQPGVADWQLFRAELLLDLGRQDEAREAVSIIRTTFVADRLSSDERDRLSSLESRLRLG